MHFLVVGAGQAGASLVARLRKGGFDGEITLIGEEPVAPYQRPPLSKKYLTGEMEVDRLLLRPESFYEDQNIRLVTNAPVTAIDAGAQTLTVGAETLSYDKLALTTGATPRRLPDEMGGGLNGIYTVRTLADVDAMAEEFAPSRRVVIIGGGYIGLEAAAVAASRGLEVTLIEAAPRILQRVASPETADHIRALHKSHGVTILEGVGVASLTGADGRVTGVALADGAELAADFVIAGIGILPETRLADAAGLALDNGIAVNAQCVTSDPAIFAAGDCASFPHGEGRLRLESVGNAIDMGEAAADNMMGKAVDYVAKPWFWSDQYDVTLQIAGLNTGYDRVITREGERGMSFWYFARDTLLAVDAANDPRAYMLGKRWIEAGVSPRAGEIAGAENLKGLAVS